MNLNCDNPPLPQASDVRIGWERIEFLFLPEYAYVIHCRKHFLKLNEKYLTLPFSADGRFESNREHLKVFI